MSAARFYLCQSAFIPGAFPLPFHPPPQLSIFSFPFSLSNLSAVICIHPWCLSFPRMKRPIELPEPPRIRSSLPPFFRELVELVLQSFLLMLHLLDLRVAIFHENHASLRSAHRVHGHRAMLRDLILNLADLLIALGHLRAYRICPSAPILFTAPRTTRRARRSTSAATRTPCIRRRPATRLPVAHHRNSVPRQIRHRIVAVNFCSCSSLRLLRPRPPRCLSQRFRRRRRLILHLRLTLRASLCSTL